MRRGRDWMTIGTSAHAATFDLRHTPLANLWGYGVRFDKREQKIKISVSNGNLKNCKAQISGILEAGLGAAAKLIKVNDYYRHYYNRHRFGNNTNWHELNMWLLRQTKDLRRRVDEKKWKIYLAHPKSVKPTYLPKRCNFFWNAEKELNCDYRLIRNPYSFYD